VGAKTDGQFDRRRLFTGAAALAGDAAALNLAGTGCSSKSAEASAGGVILVASDRNAVVETTLGKVRTKRESERRIANRL